MVCACVRACVCVCVCVCEENNTITTIASPSPGGIHPRDKRPVGRRLAQAALASVYGMHPTDTPAIATGPTLSGCQLADKTLTLKFNATLLGSDSVEVRAQIIILLWSKPQT